MLKQIIGPTGSALSGACCLGFAPFLAGLSAIGAGFLINDLMLIPCSCCFSASHFGDCEDRAGATAEAGRWYWA
jgi:hypothetical protein